MLDKLLNKTGKLLNIDARYFARSGSYIGINHIVESLAKLALNIVLARELSQIVYGQYNFILSIVGTLAFLSLQGTTTSITRSVSRGYDQTVVTGTIDRIKFSVLGSVALFITAGYMYARNDDILGNSLIVAGLFFIPYNAISGFEAFLNGKRKFREYSIYRSIITMSVAAATIIVTFITRDLFWTIVALIASNSILNIIFYLKTLKLRENRNIDKDAVGYGRHLSYIGLISTVFINIDKLIVTYFLGFQSLAIYTVAMLLPRQLKLLGKSFSAAIFPGLAALDKEKANKTIKGKYGKIVIVSIIISIIGAVLAPYAIRIIYGQSYEEAILYTQIVFAFSWLVIATTPIVDALLPAQKRNKRLLKLSIYTYSTYIVSLLVLVPLYGVIGAVIAYIINKMFTFVYLTRSLSITD